MGSLRSAVSSACVILTRAPAKTEYGAFQPQNITIGSSSFYYFPVNLLTKLSAA